MIGNFYDSSTPSLPITKTARNSLSRRNFLVGSSVAALSISLPAKAGLHLHGGGGGVPLTNRKVQVGLNPDASTYKNLLLSAFISTDAASTNYPLSLNVDQYPTGVIPTNISYSFNLPSNYTTSTVFTIAWAGTVGLGAEDRKS